MKRVKTKPSFLEEPNFKSCLSALETVATIKQTILDAKNTSESMLESELHQLRDFRKDTYSEFIASLDSDNFGQGILFAEYSSYCNFILELLTTKQLSNSTWSKILTNFLDEYDFIKPLDDQKQAYDTTLRVLDGLSKYLSVAGENAGTYHLKNIYSLTNQFIFNQNNPAEPSQES